MSTMRWRSPSRRRSERGAATGSVKLAGAAADFLARLPPLAPVAALRRRQAARIALLRAAFSAAVLGRRLPRRGPAARRPPPAEVSSASASRRALSSDSFLAISLRMACSARFMSSPCVLTGNIVPAWMLRDPGLTSQANFTAAGSNNYAATLQTVGAAGSGHLQTFTSAN